MGLGSNLGDRAGYLDSALDALDTLGDIIERSSVYETEPWGVDPAQPRYLNQVAILATVLGPAELMASMLGVEEQLGRRRRGKRESRPIDLDLLVYGDIVVDEPGLTVPHPAMHQRAFVLAPLVEIAADLTPPGFEQTVSDLLARLDSSSVWLWQPEAT